MTKNGLIGYIRNVSGVCIQCASREYQGVCPVCILGAYLVYLWVYLGVSGCILGAARGVSRRGANRVAKGLHPSARDKRDTPHIHHNYTSGYTLDT